MDRIVKKSTIFSDKQHQHISPKEHVISSQPQPQSWENSRKQLQGKSHSDVVREEKQESALTRAKDTLGKLAQRFQVGTEIDHDKPTPKPTTEEYKFKSGDRVVLQSVKERSITGTVRWVGPMRISRESDSPQVIAVGVETVSLHNYIYTVVLHMFIG